MTHLSKCFAVTRDMVESFAELTGDRNSLHLDEEIARRFRYRKPVVHGMLPFSFIVCLEELFPGSSLIFLTLNVRFLAPVFVDVPVHLEVQVATTEHGIPKFEARWTREIDREDLIKASGTFRLEGLRSTGVIPVHSASSFLTEAIEEAAIGFDQLEGRSEVLRFALQPGVMSRFQARLFRPALGRDNYDFSPNLAASLLLSTLVGMRLPGRYATFTSFKASFEKTTPLGTPCSLFGSVEQLSRADESITLSTAFLEAGEKTGSAQLRVLVNPAPRKMIDCTTIRKRYMDPDVRDKVALITGSSRGIGEAAVKLFAMHGAKAVVHYYRGKRDAEGIVDEIRASGGTAVALGCDIRDEHQVARLFASILDAYGRFDILVNNAVQEFRPRAFLKLGWEDYLEELEVSLKGLHNCCRHAVPILKKQGGGKIVNLSSVAVDNPVTGQNKYITCKSAVVGYTRSLAKELLADNIQANVVVPSMTETDLLASIPREVIRRIGAEREYGRNLTPIEVALAMLYLSSGWSDGITGQQIVLNLGEPPFA